MTEIILHDLSEEHTLDDHALDDHALDDHALDDHALDDHDFKISAQFSSRVSKTWRVLCFLLTWFSVLLCIWDEVSAFLAYKYLSRSSVNKASQDCLTAWLVLSSVGVLVTALVFYNAVCHSVTLFCTLSKLHALKHEYTVFIAYYVHEIPKSVVYLVLVTKYNFLPELEYRASSSNGSYFLGQSKYDHIYFKIITDALKMLVLFILSIIEFREIIKKDKNKVFLVLNSLACFFHMSFLISSTVLKIILEQKE